jgi:TP901 family phage tail tape measure protein
MQSELKSTQRSLGNQIRAINTQFGETLRSTGQFTSHFVTISSDVEKFGRSLDSGKMKLGQYFKVWQDHHRTAGGLIRDLAKQQVQMQNAVLQPIGKNAEGMMRFAVHVPKGLDLIRNKTALTRQELAIMNKVVQDGAQQLINWGKNTQWAGRQLTVGLTVPLVAFGKAAADAFRAADQELVRLTKVYGDLGETTTANLAQVRKEVVATAKELSTTMGVSFKDTIALGADIAATGKTGNELLSSISETTRLAVLGEVDRQDAMKATLAIQSAFKANTEELAESINFLNAVENQTSTTLNDLVEAIPKAGPVIKGLGGSVQDLALYLTAMREGGINATEGANALKSALASLINPTDVAVKKFEGFGIDLLGIVNNNAGNVTKTLLTLQSALDQLDPLAKQQAIEQLFGKFQFSRLNALFENLGKQGSQTLQVLDLMKASSEDLANIAGRELAAVTESASGKYRRALETLKADLAQTGEQFLNIATKVINATDKIINFINNLPEPMKKILGLAGGFTALVGPLIMLTGVLGNFFGYIVKGVYHFKALFKGAEGWKLLTPEIMAANNAGTLIEKTFYSDAKAAAVLHKAILDLTAQYNGLAEAAARAAIGTGAVSTTAGNPVIVSTPGGGKRIVDPTHPLAGREGTRSFAHMVPRKTDQPGSIFGVVQSSGPVNTLVGENPMIYAADDLPNIPGLTTIERSVKTAAGRQPMAVSTGVVIDEVAKQHALMAALAMQGKQELIEIEDTLKNSGMLTVGFMQTFDDILPETSRIAKNAAAASQAIIAEVQAGKVTVEQARAKIIQLNIAVEQEIIETMSLLAASRGAAFDPYTIPLLSQPSITAAGKSNMKELFHKENTRDLVNQIATLLGVRTSGAGYNLETTTPVGARKGYRQLPLPGFIGGGQIADGVYTLNDGNIVPGPKHINRDIQFGILPVDSFVVNQGATKKNLEFLQGMVGEKNNLTGGGQPVMLSPFEFVVPPEVVNEGNNLDILKGINSGQITFSNTGGKIPALQYFAAVNAGRMVARKTTPLKVTLSKSKIKKIDPKWSPRNPKRGDTWNLKPASGGVYGVDDSGVNERLATTGASASEYLESLRNAAVIKGSSNPLVGTTDDFLEALVLAGKISKSEADRVLVSLSKAYTAKVKEMSVITDPTNPYHALSERAIMDSPYAAKILPWWKQFKVKTGSIEKNRPSGSRSGASGSPTSTILVVDGEVVKVKPFEGSRKDSIKALHGANKDWSDFIEESLGTGVGAAMLGGLIQKFAAFMPGRKVQKKVGPEFEEEFPDWVIRNEKTNLSNTDPLHGPLQIGRYQPPLTIRTRRQPAGIMYRGRYTKSIWQGGPKKGEAYWSPRHTAKVEAFLTGDEAARANYIIEEYMRGAYSVMGIKGAAEALRAAAKKVSGRFYRGITLGGRSRVGGTMSALPDWLEQELELARKTGDFSGVIGREFILRRSSWSENPKTAGGFGDFFITADVKNRNAVKASEMFPDLRFPDPRTGEMLPVNESESFFGGKFRIVKASKDGMYVQSVNSPMGGNRAMGGDVNAGTPYIVGENGPEVFIPRQSGGIIPNNMMQYKLAGGGIKAIWNAIRGVLSKGKTAKAPATTAAPSGSGQMELDLGVPAAAAADDLTGQMSPFGFKGQMIGLGGSLAGGAIGQSIGGTPGFMVGSMVGNMAMFIPQLIKAAKVAGTLFKLLKNLTIGGAVITALISIGKYLLDLKKKAEDLGKANRLAFGGTQESFTSVGIKSYKSMSDRIKDINEQLELHRAKVKSVYESYTKTGVSGLSLTIEELRKAIENAKTSQKEYVEAFNNIDSGRVVEYAAQLKAQFVAMGMSAQEATNQIYAIVKASEKAGQAFSAITSKAFTSIKDSTSGIEFIINYLKESLGDTFNVEEFNTGLDTLLNAVLMYRDSLVGTADDQKNIRDEADATAETLEKIGKMKGSERIINAEQIEQLKSQNIIYGSILSSTESIESITAKILLYSSGLADVVDLGRMSAENAIALAKNFATVQNIMNSVTEDIQDDKYRNTLEPLAKVIKTVKDDSDSAAEAVKRLKKVDEDYYRNKMKAIDDLIKKLQKERDERLKLIDLQERASTFENQMKSAQIKYQQSLTAGNLAQAAQEQLNINQLSSERQRQLLRDSINDKYNDQIDKLQAQKDKLQDDLDKANKNYNAKTAAASEKAAELAKLQAYRDELELIALRNVDGPISKTDSMRIENIFKEMTDAGGELKKAAEAMRVGNPAVPSIRGTAGKSFSQVLVDNLNADVKSRAAENKTFKTAVDAFVKAVDKFKGDSTIPAAPGAGDYKNVKFGIDYSYLHFEAPSGKYVIKVNSTRYDDTFQTVKDKGWTPVRWNDVRMKGFKDLGTQGEDGELSDQNLATGGYVKGYSKAGEITGSGGTGTSDDILIRASRGEFMVNANSVASAGIENMHSINQKGADGIIEAAMRLLSGSKRLNKGGITDQQMAKTNKGLSYYDKNIDPKFESFARLTAKLFTNSPGGYILPAMHVAKDVFGSWLFGAKPTFGKRGILKDLDPKTYTPYLEAFNMSMLHPFSEIAKGSATKGDWINAALFMVPQSKAGTGLSAASRIQMSKSGAFAALSTKRYKDFVKSIYQTKYVENDGLKFPTHTIGTDSTRFGFEGYGEDLSGLLKAGKIDEIVKTTPEGILEAALKLNPKSKEIRSLLDNFKNKNITQKEIEFLDQMIGATSISNRGKRTQLEQGEGFAMLLAALKGDKNAQDIVKIKAGIAEEIVKKERLARNKEVAESYKGFRLEDGPVEPQNVPVIHSTKYPVVRDKNGNVVLHTYGDQNIGTDVAYPRASLHFTLEDTVKSHMQGQWDSAQNKIVSRLSTMIDDSGLPYQLNSTDTWWMRNPGQPLKISDASVIKPFTNYSSYADELISRGLMKAGDDTPIMAIDTKTKEILHLIKENYTDADRIKIAELQGYSAGYAETLVGKEANAIEETALQLAKQQLGIKTSAVNLEQHGLGSKSRQDHIYRIAKALGLSSEIHSGSRPYIMESLFSKSFFGPNRNTEIASNKLWVDTQEALRSLAQHGYFKTLIKKMKSADDFDFARGGYIRKFHDLRGPIPGPYNAEVGALVRAKTESIYPTGYVESLQNATMSGGNTYVLKNEIHASEGMDVNQLADVVTKRTIDTIKSIDSVNLKSTGTNRKFGGMIPA